MAKLFLLGGAPAVGKSTVAPLVAEELAPCAWVEADDLWRIHPFEVTPKAKAIVESNLVHHLREFLKADYPYVFATWVLHREDLIERLVSPLRPLATTTSVVHLVADPRVIEERLSQPAGTERSLSRALERLSQITKLPFPQIDTSELTPRQVAERVCRLVRAS